jgi:hypothetical protein
MKPQKQLAGQGKPDYNFGMAVYRMMITVGKQNSDISMELVRSWP